MQDPCTTRRRAGKGSGGEPHLSMLFASCLHLQLQEMDLLCAIMSLDSVPWGRGRAVPKATKHRITQRQRLVCLIIRVVNLDLIR